MKEELLQLTSVPGEETRSSFDLGLLLWNTLFIYCKYVLISLVNKEMVGRWLLARRRVESWRSGDSQKEQDGKCVDEPWAAHGWMEMG